jgi:site-specific DNA recombinase
VSGPSGLSDYAVSPLGIPTALLRGEVRVAVLGRCSTEEQQDPRQSLVRQVGTCRTAIPESWVIVAHFYDVESGRMDLDQRGHGTGYERSTSLSRVMAALLIFSMRRGIRDAGSMW